MAQTDAADGGNTSFRLRYEMAKATEVSSRALAFLQYGRLACALLGLAGSPVMFAPEN
jgi:hypothetical protein